MDSIINVSFINENDFKKNITLNLNWDASAEDWYEAFRLIMSFLGFAKETIEIYLPDLYELEEKNRKVIGDILRDRILYVGDKVPPKLREDLEKSIFIGTPAEIIDSIAGALS